jgi:hypothetical protein
MKVGQIVILSQPEHSADPGGKARYRLHGSPAIVTRAYEDGSADLTVFENGGRIYPLSRVGAFDEKRHAAQPGSLSYVEDTPDSHITDWKDAPELQERHDPHERRLVMPADGGNLRRETDAERDARVANEKVSAELPGRGFETTVGQEAANRPGGGARGTAAAEAAESQRRVEADRRRRETAESEERARRERESSGKPSPNQPSGQQPQKAAPSRAPHQDEDAARRDAVENRKSGA